MTSCQFEGIPHFSQQNLWEMTNSECFCVLCGQPCVILAVGKLFSVCYVLYVLRSVDTSYLNVFPGVSYGAGSQTEPQITTDLLWNDT